MPRCNIVVAVIGPGWGDVAGADDPIRFELELARQRGLELLCVLAWGAPMPRAEAFPEPQREISDVLVVPLFGLGEDDGKAVR